MIKYAFLYRNIYDEQDNSMNFFEALSEQIKKQLRVKLNKNSLGSLNSEFPFFTEQYRKNKNIVNDIFNLYYVDNGIVSYLSYRFNHFDDLFNFETVHISNLEVSEKHRGKGYFQIMMSDFLDAFRGKKMTLQAHDERLISTYEKYGFKLYKNPEDFGNLMINWD